MRTATETKGKAMKIRRSLIGLTLALTGLFATSAAAQAEVTPAPAWKVIAATGPTHLPPVQSETQRITVEAEGGDFTLAQVSEGEGHLSYGRCYIFPGVAAGATELTCSGFIPVTGEFEVGQKVTSGSGIAAGTTIETVSPDGKTITLSQPTTGETKNYISFGSKEVTSVTGAFNVGEEITGEGIPASTTVEAVGAGTLTLSNYPTKAGTVALSAGQETAPIPYDASAEELQAALEAGMPGFGPGAFQVSGGPGGDAEHPYFVTFAGEAALKDQKPFSTGIEGLEGAHKYVHVYTTVSGGNGTGEIGVFPINVGSEDTSGELTVEIGPLPVGVSIPESSENSEWTCSAAAPGATATCTTMRVAKALEPSFQVRVPMEVTATAPFTSTVPVTVSGGGGGAASYQMPLVVSYEPADAGIAAAFFGVFDADGTPATRAGGHPAMVANYLVFNLHRVNGNLRAVGDPKEVRADLPAGLIGNPLVTDRCPQSLLTGGFGTYEYSKCNAKNSSLGILYPQTSFALSGAGLDLMNDVPAPGTAAEFSSKVFSPVQGLIGSVRSADDFGVRVTAPSIATFLGVSSVYTMFEGFPEAAKGKAFFTNSTDCAEQAREAPVVRIADSTWQQPERFDQVDVPLPPVTGCDKLHFEPQFSFQPTNADGSSGTGADAHLHIDQSGLTDPEKLGTPDLKRSVVKLPAGLSVNPSQANGLAACSEAQVGYVGSGDLPNPTRFNENPVTCPDASKLGTVEATTPLLEEPLKGTIYLAKQNDNPFNSLIGLYLVIESPRFGITLKLPGKVDLDPGTGQMTATFDYVPQQPVEDLTLRFRGGGPRSTLATPEVCGRYSTTGEWEPWSAPQSGPSAQTSDSFNVSSNCASSAGARPFNPSFEAGSTSTVAGGFSPLVVKVSRSDGEQELNRLDFTMPPGFAAKLAGVPYCSDADIAAAQGKSGKDEQSSPSCPDAAKLGTTDAAAGVGGEPFHAPGTIYLAGPYKGAPLSAVVITPAVAGPFDLGNVVIRTPLSIDPVTAQVSADSDPIPTILKGIPLKLREVAIKIDKGDFSLNPTNCEAMKITASLGSSNGASASPENRFQVGGCKGLDFKPHMRLTLKGGTKRTAHPKLIAEVFSKGIGVANLARIQTKLPRSAFLDQAHIRTVCTRVQFAAGGGNGERCPKGSIYGRAWVKSPLFDYWLSGNAYLRSSNHKLPDLVLAIHGPASQPIAVELAGKTDSVKGALRNTFEGVPDAPFDKARLVLFGGKRGLVVNSRNLCRQSKRNSRANVRLSGQNGKVSQLHPIVRNDCGRAAKKKHKRHHKRSRR